MSLTANNSQAIYLFRIKKKLSHTMDSETSSIKLSSALLVTTGGAINEAITSLLN
jgi:hypothetical protein